MKRKALLSSTLLALTFPLSAFASTYTQLSPSSPNSERFNRTETIELAQRYITAQYVSSRLLGSESQILSVAYEYSGNQVNWKSINVETLSANSIQLNLVGKVPVRAAKDSNLRIGLFLERDRQCNFRVVNYDFHVWGGTFPRPVRSKVREKLRTLPNHYPRFQNVLNSILA